MTQRFSKIFYIKVIIFLIFMLLAVIVSFILGRQFGYFLMGDLQSDKKLQGAVEQAESTEGKYSPLVSPRFKYNPDEFPRDEFNTGTVEKPSEDQVVGEGVDVDMSYVGQSSNSKEIFDLGNEGTNAGQQVKEEEKPLSEEEIIESNVIYKVYLGTFSNKDNAENIYIKLKSDGYEPYIEEIIKDNQTSYRVQIGAFRNIDNANALAEELRKKGYNAWTRLTKI